MRIGTPERFQSTRPVRGATGTKDNATAGDDISIHAPRAGRDMAVNKVEINGETFQSTRPVRGATPRLAVWLHRSKNFNPRAPCGARLPLLGILLINI